MSTTRPESSAWAALPDACTALGFMAVWASPFLFGPLSVKTAMLTMLVEFFLIHATGFFTSFANAPNTSRTKRTLSVLGLAVIYVLMIGGITASFDEWWPLAAFGWLLLGKLWWIRTSIANHDSMQTQMGAWAGSVAAYLFGCFLTVIVYVPRWGMDIELQPRFGLNPDGQSGGLWIDEPHRVVAFGVVYFGVLAIGKVMAARATALKRA